MSKKQKIINELNNGSDVEKICTDLEVSTGYVYRIKREIDESEGNNKEFNESEDSTNDDLVVDSTSGDSINVEEDNENVVKEENVRTTDKTDRVGGVKKRKKRVQKEKSTKDESTKDKTGGIIKWIKNQKKKMLLILSLLILSIVMMLSFLRMKPREPEKLPIMNRFPMITG